MPAFWALPAAIAMVLVKINAGVFVAAASVLPVVLMRNRLDAQWARSYCWLEVVSIAGCVCCLLWIRHGLLVPRRDCMLAASGFVFTLSTDRLASTDRRLRRSSPSIGV